MQVPMTGDEQATIRDLAARIRAAGGWSNGVFTDLAGIRKLLNVSERTLRTWRSAGDFPKGFQAHRLLFDLVELAAWFESRKQKVTGEDRQVVDACYVNRRPAVNLQSDNSSQLNFIVLLRVVHGLKTVDPNLDALAFTAHHKIVPIGRIDRVEQSILFADR